MAEYAKFGQYIQFLGNKRIIWAIYAKFGLNMHNLGKICKIWAKCEKLVQNMQILGKIRIWTNYAILVKYAKFGQNMQFWSINTKFVQHTHNLEKYAKFRQNRQNLNMQNLGNIRKF